jgi:putative tryptophan/tyrosine transport system substrate-binding protein
VTSRSRRRFLQGSLALAGLGLLAGCGRPSLPWWAGRTVYRIGVMGERGSDPAEARLWEQFRLGLRERGWVEGENVALEYRWADGDPARLPGQAADLVRVGVDLIVARSSIFTQAAKEATASIPIVFVAHADPVATGHVASLAHPGGNVTGQAILQTVTGSKSLELLTAAVSGTARVAVLWHPDTPSHTPGLQGLEDPARALNIQLQAVAVRSGAEFEGAFAAMVRAGAQAVLILATPFFFNERRRWIELALAHRLATMYQAREAADEGALMTYGPNYDALWRNAPSYVDKILRGAKPADLPVEQATRFDFFINLKTAQALGLTIPQSVLQQATELIQ